MKRIFMLLTAMSLFACSTSKINHYATVKIKIEDPYLNKDVYTIPLEDRGWTDSKRKFYVENDYIQKTLKPWEITAFVKKYVTMGLSKELIAYMYGEPNRNVNDSTWYYLNKQGHNVLMVKFNHNDDVMDFVNYY